MTATSSTVRRLVSWTIALLILTAVPLLGLPFAVEAALSVGLIFAIAAVGLDVFMGYTGQLSFGHFGFVATGAYITAIVENEWNLGPWQALPIALVGTALVAVIIGIPMTRLPELGSSLVSFFFAFIVIVLISGSLLTGLTQGDSGLATLPVKIGGLYLDQGEPLFYFALVSLVVVTAVSLAYVSSWSGKMLRVIKQNETVATSLGAHVRRKKLTSFLYSAVLCGFAGFIFGQSLGILSPGAFAPFESIFLATMVVVGGMGSIYGPIVGALFFSVINELSFEAGASSGVIFAVVLLVALIALPGGIVGALKGLRPRLTRSRAKADDAAVHPKPQLPDELPRPASAVTTMSRAPRVDGDAVSADVPLLDVAGLAVKFGGVAALSDVNLRANAGTVHGLVGPNGAGKTTLLNCICRYQRYEGQIRLAGESLSDVAPHLLRSRGIARSFQHPALANSLTARENVELGLYSRRPTNAVGEIVRTPANRAFRSEVRAAVEEVLDLARVPRTRWDVSTQELNLAELKTLDVARALVGEPRLLLMDEPTAGLESDEMEAMSDLISLARSRGTTVLVISHHVGFLQGLVDDVTVLDFGRSIATGSFDTVFARRDVLDAFMGVGV